MSERLNAPKSSDSPTHDAPQGQALQAKTPPPFQLQAAGAPVAQLQEGGEGTTTTPDFQWEVVSDGSLITLKLGPDGSLGQEQHKVEDVRNYIVTNYNWNGVVQLMKLVDEKNDDFAYAKPGDLVGNATDNAKIVPPKAIECIIRMQAKDMIETKYKAKPASNIKGILAGVDGQPGNGFAKLLGTTYEDMVKESDNTSMKDGEKDIVMPDLSSASEEVIYDFLKSMVNARNGLWADTNHVTNIVSIRRKLDKSSAKYNDTLFVAWKDKEAKHAKQYVGSTEPGDLDVGQLLPQTTTIVSGFHTGGSSGTPGGRTRNAFRKSKDNDTQYFQKGDTTMNVHYGHPDMAGLVKEYGVGRNDDGSTEYSAAQVEAHAILIELFKILTQWGDGKASSISAYHHLEAWARDYTRSEATDVKGGDRQVTISDGQKGGLSKTLSFNGYKAHVDATYNGLVKGKASSTKEASDKAAAITLLTYYHNQAATPDRETVISGLSSKSLAELREALKVEAVWIATIDLQMKNEGSPARKVDGKPGAGTVAKAGLSEADMATQTADYTKRKEQAKTDWTRTGVLFTKWDANEKLKANTTLKTTLKESIKLDADNGSLEDAKAVDDKGGKGMDKGVGDWSEGCQIVMGGKNFYDFMHNATQYATETGQQRWYYTIIDMDTMSGVTKGAPATTTQGTGTK